MACIKFRTENPQLLDTTVQNLFATLIWHPGFVHPCITVFIKVLQVQNTLTTSTLSEVKWSELEWSYGEVLGDKVPCTLGWPFTGYLIVFYLIWCLSYTVVVLACFVMCGWVYMGVFWLFCECFGNVYLQLLCLDFLYVFCIVSFMYIYSYLFGLY